MSTGMPRTPANGEAWKFNKDGSAIDGRGDRRSAKRLRRQQACARFGVTSGRQWRKLRRAIRRAGKMAPEATAGGTP